MHAKHVIEVNDEAGVRASKSFQPLVHETGGYDQMEFTEKAVKNYIQREIQAVDEERDAHALLQYFVQMKEQNQNFVYELEVDRYNQLKNVFWADARSREAYKYFGDVVSFDTTYNTNRYGMPFGSFVGVNHHGSSVLLGCALIRTEDIETFTWLFNVWVKCMFGKPPIGIVTDQAAAMKNAIENVLPNTRHRWCIWHILKKIREKMCGHKFYQELKTEIKRIVYESPLIEQFEVSWNTFLEK